MTNRTYKGTLLTLLHVQFSNTARMSSCDTNSELNYLANLPSEAELLMKRQAGHAVTRMYIILWPTYKCRVCAFRK